MAKRTTKMANGIVLTIQCVVCPGTLRSGPEWSCIQYTAKRRDVMYPYTLERRGLGIGKYIPRGSRASLTVRFLRYEVEKGLRAVYPEDREISQGQGFCTTRPRGTKSLPEGNFTVQGDAFPNASRLKAAVYGHSKCLRCASITSQSIASFPR